MSDYTPTTPDVRDSWRRGRLWAIGSNSTSEAEFDRWLATTKADTLREAADAMDADPEFRDPLRLKSGYLRSRADKLDPS